MSEPDNLPTAKSLFAQWAKPLNVGIKILRMADHPRDRSLVDFQPIARTPAPPLNTIASYWPFFDVGESGLSFRLDFNPSNGTIMDQLIASIQKALDENLFKERIFLLTPNLADISFYHYTAVTLSVEGTPIPGWYAQHADLACAWEIFIPDEEQRKVIVAALAHQQAKERLKNARPDEAPACRQAFEAALARLS